jgi:hypothetical protein
MKTTRFTTEQIPAVPGALFFMNRPADDILIEDIHDDIGRA